MPAIDFQRARPLRVVQILPALDGGGVERGTVEVANALTAAGHTSTVISAGGRLVGEMPGTEHIGMRLGAKSPLTLRYVPIVRRYLSRARPDIVHARSRVPAWIAYLAWRGMDPARRPRFLTTVHGLYSVSRYSAVMARGEDVIAVSDAVRSYLLAHYSRYLDPSRLHVIYRGVDRALYSPSFRPAPRWLRQWREQFPHLQGRTVLTLPARLSRLKGHHEFLKLVAALRRRGIDAHGLIVGGEDPRRTAYARELKTAAAAPPLAGHIDFLGHRTDLREILSVSDLTLSLSTKPESFGRTVLEALALGRPVVGYAHGGVAEILAAMFPSGSVAAGNLEAAIEVSMRSLSSPGAITPAPQFELEQMLASTLGLYQRVAGAQGI